MSADRALRGTDHRATSRRALLLVLALIAGLFVAAPGSHADDVTLPEFTYHTTLVEQASWTGAGLQHPTIVRAADHFTEPLGAYYLYFGTGTENGIGLAYGDSPDGPFTPYADNPVVRSTSGPHALFDDEAGELLLYLHGTTSIAVATSSDGVNFSSPQPLFNASALDGVSRFQLPRVFEHSLPSVGNRFTMLVMGIDSGTRKLFLATSDDGRDWDLRPDPVVSPGPGEGGQIASGHLLEVGGETLVAYHAASGNIHATRVGADFDVEDHLGVLHAPIADDPDRGRVAAPAFFVDDGVLMMAYEAGPSGSSRIAVATTEFRPLLERLPAYAYEDTLVDGVSWTGGGLQHPALIRAGDHLDAPLGEYHLYFGSQNQGGIGLAYADDIDGPYTLHEGPVVTNASGPHAVWDETSGEFRLYFHRGNTIQVATSTDGVDFGTPQQVLANSAFSGISDLQLPRVFAYELPSVGNTWTMLVMGNQGGTRKIFLATSDDGLDWSVRPDPIVTPAAGENGQVASPHLYEHEGQVYVTYHAASGRIHAAFVGADLDREIHLGVFHEPMGGAPDNGRVAAPSFLEGGGTWFMAYEAGTGSSSRIALATSDGEPRGSLPGEQPPAPVDPPEWPDFEHQGVVFVPDEQAFNPTGEFIFPHVIRASDHFDDPLGEFYLYTGPHENPGGITLQYSDSLDGPWTEYGDNPLISNVWEGEFSVSHVSTPHAFFNDDDQTLYLYFHGENNQTRLATSTDGLHFEHQGVVLSTADIPGNSESSYARVFEYTIPSIGNRYIMMLMGNQSGTRKIWLATSDDLVDWTARTTPLISPGPGESGQISSPWFFPWDDRYFVLYHSGSGTIHATEVGEDFDREDHLGVFYRSSTGLRSAAPSFIVEGSTMYMFYELGQRLNARIAYATADLTPFLDEPDDDVPPRITCAADPSTLWPPNGQLVDVSVDVEVEDDGSGVSGFELVSITSSDGDSAGDVAGFTVGEPSVSGQLRATRTANLGGRVYSLHYEARDLAGNTASCVAEVTVPRDRGLVP